MEKVSEINEYRVNGFQIGAQFKNISNSHWSKDFGAKFLNREFVTTSWNVIEKATYYACIFA
jgi:hypothetical protein